MYIYIILIFSFIFCEIYSVPLKLKFKTRFNKEKMNQGNVMEMLINNDIIIPISFGSNEQIIEMNVKLQKDSTFILSNKCQENTLAKKFYKDTSKSYKEIIEENKYYMYEFSAGALSKDKIVLSDKDNKKITIDEFKFVLATKLWSDAQADMGGMLGLILSNKDDRPKDTDFITQLKQNKVIDSYSFMLEYTNEYEGILYLGDYFNGSNTVDDLKTTLAGRSNMQVKQWEIVTEKFFSGNTVVQNDTYIRLHYEMGIIAAPEIYRDYIKSNFFKNYLDKGICKLIFNLEEISVFNNYDYIACDKCKFKPDAFPELKFYSQDLNFNFTLNYTDLFYEFGNKIYFLVVFPRYPIEVKYWYIGKPFFLKYKLFMNKDKKTIGLYKNNNKKEIIIIEIEAKNNNKNLYIFIIILLVCVLIGVLYYLLKLRISKKLRANELEDKFSYIPIEESKKKTKKLF